MNLQGFVSTWITPYTVFTNIDFFFSEQGAIIVFTHIDTYKFVSVHHRSESIRTMIMFLKHNVSSSIRSIKEICYYKSKLN